jgi:exopolyphosphatase/guanosine-5'-triphosphate,3'-diphosphate pyrophosphatase
MAVLPLRVGVFDLGTNTFNLVIGSLEHGQLQLHHRALKGVGLGKGLVNGRLSERAIELAIQALRELKEAAATWSVARWQAIGTSALRQASNGAEFCRRLEAELGIAVEIIPGLDEADYILEGVRLSGVLGNEPMLLVDIGGGSVELILASRQHCHWKCSLEIGVGRAGQRFPLSDPPLPAELEAVKNWYQQALSLVLPQLKSYHLAGLVGVAGGFDTLAAMVLPTGAVALPNYLRISGEDFNHCALQIMQSRLAERNQLPAMLPIRAESIPYAMVLTQILLENTQVAAFYTTTFSLREGVLAKLVQDLP